MSSWAQIFVCLTEKITQHIVRGGGGKGGKEGGTGTGKRPLCILTKTVAEGIQQHDHI